MKRGIVILIVAILLLNLFIVSADSSYLNPNPSDNTPGSGDVNTIQNATNQIPIEDNGTINTSGFVGWTSKAELRIKAINQWLVDNASWLKVVFGMVPEISWLFAINIYMILLGIVVLVLNADAFVVEWIKNKNLARLFGAIVLVIGMMLKYTVFAANIILKLIQINWAIIKVGGTIAIIIAVIVIVVLAIFAPAVLVKLLAMLRQWQEARKKKQEEEKTEVAQKVTQKIAEGMIKKDLS